MIRRRDPQVKSKESHNDTSDAPGKRTAFDEVEVKEAPLTAPCGSWGPVAFGGPWNLVDCIEEF